MPRKKSGPTVTTTDMVAQFRAHYFETGNVAECSRRLGISYEKARALASAANKDPKFLKARHEAYQRLLPDVEAMLTQTAQIINERVCEPDLKPRELAMIAVELGLKNFTYQNPKPQYFKGLVDWYKSLTFHRKAVSEAELKQKALEAGNGDGKPIEIVITGPSD